MKLKCMRIKINDEPENQQHWNLQQRESLITNGCWPFHWFLFKEANLFKMASWNEPQCEKTSFFWGGFWPGQTQISLYCLRRRGFYYPKSSRRSAVQLHHIWLSFFLQRQTCFLMVWLIFYMTIYKWFINACIIINKSVHHTTKYFLIVMLMFHSYSNTKDSVFSDFTKFEIQCGWNKTVLPYLF